MVKKKTDPRKSGMGRLDAYLNPPHVTTEDRAGKVKAALAEYQAKTPEDLTDSDFASFINGLRIPDDDEPDTPRVSKRSLSEHPAEEEE